MEIKKELIGSTWNGKGFKVEIKKENIEILKHLGADVFKIEKKKKKKNEN